MSNTQRFPIVFAQALLVAMLVNSLSIAVGTAVRPQASGEDWPMLQANPQRTGWSSRELLPPYTHKWTWVPPDQDILQALNQPVVGDGKVYIGSYTGMMYAIDDSTGQTAWSYQTGGGIMHSATFYDGKVYFTSLDFNIYCLDADGGNELWAYETEAEMVTSPLVVNGTVYVGSRDGCLYALDAQSGDLKWRYQTDGPIDQTAAYSASREIVVFGSDDMHVYALRDMDNHADLGWKSDKLYGQMLGHYWPVISEESGLVMVRTLPAYQGQGRLGEEVERILCDLCPVGCEDWNQTVTCDIWPIVQERLRAYYREDPHRRTFFALDLDTGEDVFADNPPAVPYIGRHADVPSSPWVDDQGNIYVHFRSTSSFSQEFSFGTHFTTDIGTLDPQTGEITTLITPARSVSTRFGCMCLDDNCTFTMGGSILYGNKASRGAGALDLTDNQPHCIFRNREDSPPWCGLVVYEDRSSRGISGDGGNRGEGGSGLAISGDTMYATRAPYGEVVAVKGAPR